MSAKQEIQQFMTEDPVFAENWQAIEKRVSAGLTDSEIAFNIKKHILRGARARRRQEGERVHHDPTLVNNIDIKI
jgi:hypothetical protein